VTRARAGETSRNRARNLTEKILEAALEGLASGEIAARCGVHRVTVWRTLADPKNAARMAAVTEQRHRAAALRLGELVEVSLELVSELVTDRTAPAQVRLRAAQLVLDRALPPTIRAEFARPPQGVDIAPLLRQLVALEPEEPEELELLEQPLEHKARVSVTPSASPRPPEPQEPQALKGGREAEVSALYRHLTRGGGGAHTAWLDER
jgi:AcrR family transcriptional regulator